MAEKSGSKKHAYGLQSECTHRYGLICLYRDICSYFLFDYAKILTDSLRHNLIVSSALYLALIIGGMNLVIGNASDYKIRVRKRVNKKVIKHYTLGLNLWIFGLIPYFIIMATIFILNSN